MTDGRMDRRTDGGDCNIPNAFLKKRGDNYAQKFGLSINLWYTTNKTNEHEAK